MTSGQKIIKWLAIILASFIILMIVSIGLFTISIVFKIFNYDNLNSNLIETNQNIEIKEEFTNLDISLKNTKLIIKNGDIFKAETNNSKIETSFKNNTLIVKETSFNLFQNDDDLELIIYIPSNITIDKFKLEVSASSIQIESLKTNELDFKLGAGVTIINNLEVFNKASIEGGAGSIQILDGKINNLDLEMGVGKSTLKSLLIGKTKIESGVGEMDITILNSKDDYTIYVQKGIGSIVVDSIEVFSKDIIGNGSNILDIDSGIGKINISFQLK